MTFFGNAAAKAMTGLAVLLAIHLIVVMPARRWAILTVLAVTVCGCLPFLHPWATDRALEGTYDQVFQATLETLEARGFPLKRVDRDEGVIDTGKRPVDGVSPHRRVETVRAKIEDEGEGEASVRLLMTFLDPAPSPSLNDGTRRSSEAAGQAVDRSVIYDDYLDAIAARVQDFRDTDAS